VEQPQQPPAGIGATPKDASSMICSAPSYVLEVTPVTSEQPGALLLQVRVVPRGAAK